MVLDRALARLIGIFLMLFLSGCDDWEEDRETLLVPTPIYGSSGIKFVNMFIRMDGRIENIQLRTGIDATYLTLETAKCGGLSVAGVSTAIASTNVRVDEENLVSFGMYRGNSEGVYYFLRDHVFDDFFVQETIITLQSEDMDCAKAWLEESATVVQGAWKRILPKIPE